MQRNYIEKKILPAGPLVKRGILLVVAVLIALSAKGQIPILDELLMKKCEFDSTAEAMILAAKGKVKIGPDYSTGSVIEYYYRIKIFNKAALDDWGNIFLDAKQWEIRNVKGTTYNLVNGKITETPLGKESIFRGKLSKKFQLNRVTMPNVVEGSVIEFSFTRKIIGFALPSWRFQRNVPTLISEYEIDVPFTDFRGDVRGPHPIKTHEEKNEGKNQRWVMEKIPGFRTEPMMPHNDIYIARIIFWPEEKDWAAVNEFMVMYYGLGRMVDSQVKIIKEKVAEIKSQTNDTFEKMKKVSEWIKATQSWNGFNGFTEYDIDELLEKKTGNAGEINLLMAAMLEECGLNVDRVLLSTRENGFALEDVPSIAQFDYVICLVNISESKQVFMDATDKYLPYDVLPERCINYKGFVVSNSKPRWVSIPDRLKRKITITEDLNLVDTLSSKAKLTIVADEYSGWRMREEFLEEKELKNQFLRAETTISENSQAIFKNTSDVQKPFIVEQTIDAGDHILFNSDKKYLRPFEDLRKKSNPLVAATRQYPVEFESLLDETTIINIQLPANTTIEEIPKSVAITLPDNAARYFYNVTKLPGRISITSRFQINKKLFLPQDYPKLRELYAQMISKQEEMIVVASSK